jgi:hypothetical protein
MSALRLHPSFIERDGKREYAVLPYDEFLELQTLLEDAQDLLALRQAKEEDEGDHVSLAAIEARLRDALGEDWEERASQSKARPEGA